jgi:hypothetical protein
MILLTINIIIDSKKNNNINIQKIKCLVEHVYLYFITFLLNFHIIEML